MSAVDFEYCKDEVIAFGEWLSVEGWAPGRFGDWVKESEGAKTTEELYQEYLLNH